MSIKVKCPFCNKILSFQESYRDKKVKCPSCKSAIYVQDSSVVIEVQCPLCGKVLSFQEAFRNKRIKCPECKATMLVKDAAKDDDWVLFSCQCGKKIRASSNDSGKHITCPNCSETITIPYSKRENEIEESDIIPVILNVSWGRDIIIHDYTYFYRLIFTTEGVYLIHLSSVDTTLQGNVIVTKSSSALEEPDLLVLKKMVSIGKIDNKQLEDFVSRFPDMHSIDRDSVQKVAIKRKRGETELIIATEKGIKSWFSKRKFKVHGLITAEIKNRIKEMGYKVGSSAYV